MAAYSHSIPLATSVETVAVLAARSAVSLARELNFDQVIFEGDMGGYHQNQKQWGLFVFKLWTHSQGH